MNFEEYIKNETKSLNLKLLSEETRNFIPAISGNFIEDKKLFSNFWNKVKLEKVSLKTLWLEYHTWTNKLKLI